MAMMLYLYLIYYVYEAMWLVAIMSRSRLLLSSLGLHPREVTTSPGSQKSVKS